MTTLYKISRKSGDAASHQLLAELSAALGQVRQGDFTVRLRRRTGMAGEVVDAFNDVVAREQQQLLDLVRISRLVGREGRLTERLDEEGADGGWGGEVRAVNALID